jgi:vacuolar-type H+-ATPase subunit I/STV1
MEGPSRNAQIKTVEDAIAKVERKIEEVEDEIKLVRGEEEKKQLRKEKEQLREEKKQLREKELLLLRAREGLSGVCVCVCVCVFFVFFLSVFDRCYRAAAEAVVTRGGGETRGRKVLQV